VKHPSFIPLSVNFRDYDITGIEGKVCYRLTLLMPDQKKQKLTVKYTPSTAMVIIDSKIYRGNGCVELELPVGDHSYVIAEDGYDPIEGVARLNATTPRIITETLLRTSKSPTVEKTPQSSSEPLPPSTVHQSDAVVTAHQNQAIETVTVRGVSFNMVRVDGGTFQMGSNDSEAESDEKPVHQVTLSSYSIGETEVTQELWQAVMGSNPSYFKGANLPVEQVSWDACQEFIDKLNNLTGHRFRLPTEAEWEYAARGGNKSRGYKYSGSNTIDDVAWYDGNSGGKTHPGKTKQSNELGLYDMSGNVWEWCQDRYGKYSSGSQTNPTGSNSGNRRVGHGGSWNHNARFCRFSIRGASSPSLFRNHLGLRLAL